MEQQVDHRFLLVICAALVCFGALTIAVSPGFFMNLLGACIAAAGGSAAYLILSHRADRHRSDKPLAK